MFGRESNERGAVMTRLLTAVLTTLLVTLVVACGGEGTKTKDGDGSDILGKVQRGERLTPDEQRVFDKVMKEMEIEIAIEQIREAERRRGER